MAPHPGALRMGGTLENGLAMAAHESLRIIKRYDRIDAVTSDATKTRNHATILRVSHLITIAMQYYL
jgi:hypothetical protein